MTLVYYIYTNQCLISDLIKQLRIIVHSSFFLLAVRLASP